MNLSVGPNVQSFSGKMPLKTTKSAINTTRNYTKNLLEAEEKPVGKKNFIQKYFECLVEGLDAFKTAITKR